MRTSGLLVAAVLLAVAVTGCGGSVSGKGANALVFVSTRDGVYDLYASKADGSDQHRLTADKGEPSKRADLFYQNDPAWSADGKRIVFSSSRDGQLHLYVVDAAGKKTTRLTSGPDEDSQPTWSPDGRRIAFQRGAPSRIYVMHADGSGAQPLTGAEDEQTDPAWSPDGRWIAFSRRTPGTSVREIWLAHPDGAGAHALTKLGASSTAPAWSPDGGQIAFASNAGGRAEGGHVAIYSIDVDSHKLGVVSSSPSGDDVDPAWTPDGRRISFSRDGAIVVVPLGPGAETVLTDAKNNDSSPAWKPKP